MTTAGLWRRGVFLSLLFLLLPFAASAESLLRNLTTAHGKLVLDFSKTVHPSKIRHFVLRGEDSLRYVFDFPHTRLRSKDPARRLTLPKSVRSVRCSQFRRDTVRLVVETAQDYPASYAKRSTHILEIDLPRQAPSVRGLFSSLNGTKSSGKSGSRSESKSKNGGKTGKRAHLMKPPAPHPHHRYRIIVDPGHGGHDSGALGQSRRWMEKNAVLQIARRVRRHLKELGFSVLMTRSSDRFVKLRYRTRYANRKHGDIFVSIHANAVPRRKWNSSYGIETYYLSPARSSRARRVAAAENSVVLNRKDRLTRSILLSAIMTGPKIVLSNKLALDVQKSILSSLRKHYDRIKDGGVRPAPFWVLVGAEMPAILVETGYITNPMERRRLFDPVYQDRLARGIAEGIARYLVNREREFE